MNIEVGKLEHLGGKIDACDFGAGFLASNFNGYLRSTGPYVEYGIVTVPYKKEIGGEHLVNRRVVHLIVIECFVRGVHDLGFEHARKHCAILRVRTRPVAAGQLAQPVRLGIPPPVGRAVSNCVAHWRPRSELLWKWPGSAPQPGSASGFRHRGYFGRLEDGASRYERPGSPWERQP